MSINKKKFKRSIFHIHEDNRIAFGFTESDADINDIGEYLNAEKILQLEQVHGNKIFFSNNIQEKSEGDGIILCERKILIVIRTADCVPLFFRTRDYKYAGIIHIGWRGLYLGIGQNLIDLLKRMGTGTNDLFFFTGPAIEGRCYNVQSDLVEKFRESDFIIDDLFKKIANGQYLMDLIKGITVCLKRIGVPKRNITHSDICTFCDKRFPSYRRSDQAKRIFNFVLFK